MIKVFIPYPNEDWVCDTIINEFRKYTTHEYVGSIAEADVIFLYAKWIHNHFPVELLKSKPVVTTVHHIVPEKLKVNEFEIYDNFTTVYHVPNEHTKKQLIAAGAKKPINVISYWVNDKRWKVEELYAPEPPANCFVASFQRDTEGGSSPPKPKLEKGPDIFVDVVKALGKMGKVEPFYPGWRREYITENLKEFFDYSEKCGKLPAGNMNGLYNLVRRLKGYYLVTSRYEGGPQAVLEAALTKTKILSTDVGIASDVLHPSCICGKHDDPKLVETFVERIKNDIVTEDVIEYNYQSAMRYAIDKMVPMYDAFLKEVYDASLHQS